MRDLDTERLQLRRLCADDAAFILELLNEPAFITNIGDRGVRDLDGARQYIAKGPVASYALHGFGMYWVGLKAAGTPLGICGLIKRETLEHPDIGFAYLQRHGSQGYAHEAARAVMDHARQELNLPQVLAIVLPGNRGSIRLLEKIGLRYEKMLRIGDEELMLYATMA